MWLIGWSKDSVWTFYKHYFNDDDEKKMNDEFSKIGRTSKN